MPKGVLGGYVPLDGCSINGGHRVVERRGVLVYAHHQRALPRERLGDRSSDAVTSAGHDRGSAGQVEDARPGRYARLSGLRQCGRWLPAG